MNTGAGSQTQITGISICSYSLTHSFQPGHIHQMSMLAWYTTNDFFLESGWLIFGKNYWGILLYLNKFYHLPSHFIWHSVLNFSCKMRTSKRFVVLSRLCVKVSMLYFQNRSKLPIISGHDDGRKGKVMKLE